MLRLLRKPLSFIRRDFRMSNPYIYYEELLSPQEYIVLYFKRNGNIKISELLPVKLGDKHFGKIKVTYNEPVYKTEL